ncbi:MAG: SDR family oxidoreductase [Chloroflexi bacterium]|nr:SDR family oxidoreductase [Chloroflexota bacterium]MCL5025811.1 SDR family oxidoreductase [Chloroflexota bacterium]
MILKDKVAVVTGSTKGIGRGIVRRFAREGAKVVVNGRNPAEVDALVSEIKADGSQVIGVVADVTQEPQVQRLFDETLRAFGTVDILVNNAQTYVNKGEKGPFLKMTSAGWDEYVRLNMGALFYCTHRAAQIMAEKRHGAIVNMSSNAASRAHRLSIAYDSVKGAIDSFTRAVAVDLAPWGIRVNAIRPGMIAATGWENVPEEEKARRRSVIPLGREGFPEDIAWAAVFLAADDAGYVTGQCFEVDGGLLAQGRAPCAELHKVVTPENIDRF